jgi:hypothetical protein
MFTSQQVIVIRFNAGSGVARTHQQIWVTSQYRISRYFDYILT